MVFTKGEQILERLAYNQSQKQKWHKYNVP